jgi:hypothetical protein
LIVGGRRNLRDLDRCLRWWGGKSALRQRDRRQHRADQKPVLGGCHEIRFRFQVGIMQRGWR